MNLDMQEWRELVKPIFLKMHELGLAQLIINRNGAKARLVAYTERQFERMVDEVAVEMEQALAADPDWEKLPKGKWRYADPLDAAILTEPGEEEEAEPAQREMVAPDSGKLDVEAAFDFIRRQGE